jgi:hypothetical protein
MSATRPLNVPAFVALAVTCAIGIILIGGCPQQQVPRQPASQDETNVTPPPTNEQTTPERPIPPPPAEEGQGNQGGTTEPTEGETGGGDNTGGGTGAASFTIGFTNPLNPLGVRPGTKIDLDFKLTDRQGVITKAEFVLARDNNQDGRPDGAPLTPRTVSLAAGPNTITYDTRQALPLLINGFGRFLLGLRVQTSLGEDQTTYAPGTVTIDSVPPSAAWLSPTDDALINPQTWTVKLQTIDNSQHTVRILLDNDTNPSNGYAGFLVGDTTFNAGFAVREFNVPISISAGTYYYYVVVSDGIDPPTEFYAPNLTPGRGQYARLAVTNRIIGKFDLNQLDPQSSQYAGGGASSRGAILQGFNFNDLAGSSMASVPDLNGDGKAELLVASRFGKPYIVNTDGVGWGEAYMIYGSSTRLRDKWQLNSVGRGPIPGLVFPGLRAPVGTTWTEGLSDVTVVPDMDGDNLPELVFSFPRVESVSLSSPPPVQHPDLQSDYPGLGALEYDAYFLGDPNDPHAPPPGWIANTAQFTRGGIVIVSSHSPMLKTPSRLNRKGNRIVDLAEVGQVFSDTMPANYELFIWEASKVDLTAACPDGDQSYEDWLILEDIAFETQGPGGFDNHFSAPQLFGIPRQDPAFPKDWIWDPDPYQPPLANIRPLDIFLPEDPDGTPLSFGDPCGDPACVFTEMWENDFNYDYYHGTDFHLFPFPIQNYTTPAVGEPDPFMWHAKGWHASWTPGPQSGKAIWTGFCGRFSARVTPAAGGNECGARILGQRREDRFGTAVGADGNFLYISAPQRTALKAGDNVPSLDADRARSGVVYQLRTNAHPYNSAYTMTQLWIEPGAMRALDPNDPNYPSDPNDPNAVLFVPAGYPYVDAEIPDRQDTAMPTPHQYIIETNGYTRGGDDYWDRLARYAPNPPPPTLLQAPEGVEDRRWLVDYTGTWSFCGIEYTIEDYWGVPSITIGDSPLWPHYSPEAAEYYIDRTAQIVGPHVGAYISFVRGLGDVNGDGVPDFGVGSADVRQSFSDPQNPTGPTVGAVFIVFGRQTGLEGDVLLNRMALPPSSGNRIHGVLLRGNTDQERLGRVFDDAGDFDGDGYSDVVVGSEGSSAKQGQVIVILGSPTLESPANGWTVNDIVKAGRAIRFTGERPGDLAGANVAGAGDVDGDGISDILIAAPGYDDPGNPARVDLGAVYLIYGSPSLRGQELSLSKVGTFDLPGVRFVGRGASDALGGGELVFDANDPTAQRQFFLSPGDPTHPYEQRVEVYSRGVARLGDIDGDGKGDYAISAMLADPNGRVDAGEVYVIYGRGD